MAEKFRDFDAFYREMKRAPIRMKLFGEIEELPPALPATIMLEVLRIREKHGANAVIPDEIMLTLAQSLFGDRMARWLTRGLDIEQLGEIVRWVMGQYTGATNVVTDSETDSATVDETATTGDDETAPKSETATDAL